MVQSLPCAPHTAPLLLLLLWLVAGGLSHPESTQPSALCGDQQALLRRARAQQPEGVGEGPVTLQHAARRIVHIIITTSIIIHITTAGLLNQLIHAASRWRHGTAAASRSCCRSRCICGQQHVVYAARAACHFVFHSWWCACLHLHAQLLYLWRTRLSLCSSKKAALTSDAW
jgi:hypothetical protein